MAFSAVAIIASTAMNMYAAYQQGQQQQAVARYNAKVAQNQATAQRQAAEVAASNKQEETRRLLAAQRVRAGASGIIQTEGSPLLAELDSATSAALDVARIRWGGEQAARASESEVKLQKYYSRVAQSNARMKMVGSLLQGVSAGASMYKGGGGDAGYSTSPGFQAQRAGERMSY